MQNTYGAVEKLKDADKNNFEADDVFFECPRCGKSMAISHAGIGLVVTCPDCGLDMIVPSRGEAAEPHDDEVGERDAEPSEVVTEAAPSAAAHQGNYSLTREKRELLFDEVAAVQRALDRIVSVLDGLND